MNIVREELCEPAGQMDDPTSGHHDHESL
jgi:hypothetical protein